PEFSDLHSGGQHWTVRLADAQESVGRADVGRGRTAVPDLLRDYRIPVARHVGRVRFGADRLWVHDGGDADSGDQRIRHGAGSIDTRQGVTSHASRGDL